MSIKTHLTLLYLLPAILLSSCAKQTTQLNEQSPTQLRKQARNELIVGVTTGAVSAGAATTGGILAATASLAALPGFILFLPIAIITAPIAIAFIVKGIKHHKKAKRVAKLEAQTVCT